MEELVRLIIALTLGANLGRELRLAKKDNNARLFALLNGIACIIYLISMGL